MIKRIQRMIVNNVQKLYFKLPKSSHTSKNQLFNQKKGIRCQLLSLLVKELTVKMWKRPV